MAFCFTQSPQLFTKKRPKKIVTGLDLRSAQNISTEQAVPGALWQQHSSCLQLWTPVSQRQLREKKENTNLTMLSMEGSLGILSMTRAGALLDPRGYCCICLLQFYTYFNTLCFWFGLGFFGPAIQLYFKTKKLMFWGKKIDGGLMHFCSFTTYVLTKGSRNQ